MQSRGCRAPHHSPLPVAVPATSDNWTFRDHGQGGTITRDLCSAVGDFTAVFRDAYQRALERASHRSPTWPYYRRAVRAH